MPQVPYEAIVSSTDRPTLVLAGPGAGKTYLLGDRVSRLLSDGSDHGAMTLLTFAKDATQNMRTKLQDRAHGFGIPHDQLPHVSTLHALGYEIVGRDPHAVNLRKTNLGVQPDQHVADLIFRDAAMAEGLSGSLAGDAKMCKAHGDCTPSTSEQRCAVCRSYWRIMSKCNRVDYDDQVLLACRILEANDSLLGEYQARCHHLLVDEYQDINAAQFRLIKLLSGENVAGLFAVGDDAQSIYSFRGASPDFILRFAEDFSDAWTPPLAYSRRCHEGILDVAQSTLHCLCPGWSPPPDIEYTVESERGPRVWKARSEKAEAMWVARLARQAVTEHKTVLVLVPKRAFFPLISATLARFGVAHDCQDDLLSNSTRQRLTVACQLLRWVRNPEDNFATRLAIECVLDHAMVRVPGAGGRGRLKKETIERRIAVEKEIGDLWRRVSSRRKLIGVLDGLDDPSADLAAIRAALSLLRTTYGEREGDFAKALAQACGEWMRPQDLAADLLALEAEIDGAAIPGFSSVQLMTLRKSKGLEADVVVLVGLEDDIMPAEDGDEEEQARLFYVGMTRAKHEVHMIHSIRRPRNVSFGQDITNKPRSRFLDAAGIESDWTPYDLDTA